MIRSGNNGSKGIQQMRQLKNAVPAPVRAYSYLMTRPVIKAAFGKIEIMFYHEEEIQTGGNHICCNLKNWLSKILNSRTIPEQALKNWIFSSTFPVPKTSRTIEGIQEMSALKFYVWNYMYCPVIFHSPSTTKGSALVILKISHHRTHHLIKRNLKSSSHPS